MFGIRVLSFVAFRDGTYENTVFAGFHPTLIHLSFTGTLRGVSLFWILGLIASVFSAGYFFERLLMIEYKEYRQGWEKDGRPFGYYWMILSISEFPKFSSFRARTRCFYRWMFLSPEWAAYSTDAKMSLWGFRFSLILALVFAIIWLCFNGRFL